ncbi:MAG: hypothetical protein ACRECO_11325 [Xanthobacteraceae bacterium]
MDDRKQMQPVEIPELPNLGLLFGVVAAAFVAIGVTIYFFGENQSSMTAADTTSPRIERVMKAPRGPAAEPSTIGQGDAP